MAVIIAILALHYNDSLRIRGKWPLFHSLGMIIWAYSTCSNEKEAVWPQQQQVSSASRLSHSTVFSRLTKEEGNAMCLLCVHLAWIRLPSYRNRLKRAGTWIDCQATLVSIPFDIYIYIWYVQSVFCNRCYTGICWTTMQFRNGIP